MRVYKKSYYIGIDGGATKTLVALSDKMGNIIDVIKLGGTNYQTVGIENTKKVLEEALKTIVIDHKVNISDIEGICFGGAGIDSNEGIDIITNIFRRLGYKNELTVCNDGLIALIGANGGYSGGVIIAGTGSVAIGIDDNKKLHKVGGWGHILDDGGSGYAIGRNALLSIMKWHDGRGEETSLWKKVRTHLNIENPEQIIDFVYCTMTKKHDVASIAPFVLELYKKDKVSTEIIEKAISDLSILAITLAKNIKKESFSLGLYGGIIVGNYKLKEKLIEKIRESYPNIEIHLPYEEAYVGALNVALGKVKIN